MSIDRHTTPASIGGESNSFDTEVSRTTEKQRRVAIDSLNKVRLLPADWTDEKGNTRDTLIRRLEAALDQLEQYETTATIDNPSHSQSETGPFSQISIEHANPEEVNTSQPAEYWSANGIQIPICPFPTNTPEWEAVPGKVFVSGGHKFSEVKFIKDSNGLSHTAKPGELMNFSNKHAHQRLESLDTVLEGSHELHVFKEVLTRLGTLSSAYHDLNPDGPSYENDASHIASQIDSLTSTEGIKNYLSTLTTTINNIDDFSQRASEIIKMRTFLRSIDESMSEFVPAKDSQFKLTPFYEQKLSQFASLINRQLGTGNNAYLQELAAKQQMPEWEHLSAKGMTVIVGPRGSGKNKLADYYCHRSNRPLFRYACSPDKEERDLTYDVELHDGEVVRVPTRILTAITTPNAILELDELNLLRPNVAKFFNSLFDGDRSVFLNDQVIKAAPGVVFVGLMNPAEYDGVEDLPETIDDRSNIMSMGYPPFRAVDEQTSQEVFTADEALILKNAITPLRDISDSTFLTSWNYVVNAMGATISIDPETATMLKDLKDIINIADRTRQVAESYKKRTGDARLERDISLRGSLECARFYSDNHLWSANLPALPDWQQGWTAAQYAAAMTYLPHTSTYRRGSSDRDTFLTILAEGA